MSFWFTNNDALFNSTKPPDDDNRTDGALDIAGVMEFANVTPAPSNFTEASTVTKFPGQFVSHHYCLDGITQRHMYYIFLVRIIINYYYLYVYCY